MSVPTPPISDLLAHLQAGDSPLDPHGREAFLARAPGRLDIIGGIGDYAGSLVCQYPIDRGTAVAVQRRDDRRVILRTYNNLPAPHAPHVELSLDDLWGTGALLSLDSMHSLFSGPHHWAAFVAGAYWVLAKHRKLNRRAHGANIAVYSDVPIKTGLASSAALTVATLTAMTAAYHLILDPIETAVFAQRIENQIANAPRGVMDPMTATLGRAGKMLILRCQPHTIERYLDLPPGVLVAGISTGLHHDAGDPTYRDVRIATFMAQGIVAKAYRDLGVRSDPTAGHLANVAPDLYRTYFRAMLPQRLSGRDFLRRYENYPDHATVLDPDRLYRVRAAADHHIVDHARSRAFVESLTAAIGERRPRALARAGRLMLASHASYTHRAGLGSPETDQLVHALCARPHRGIYGARINSAGAGGTVTLLADDTPAVREQLQRITDQFRQTTGNPAALITGTSAGAVETGAIRWPSH